VIGPIDAAAIRAVLGADWSQPIQYGVDGYGFTRRSPQRSLIVSWGPFDGVDYIHASIASRSTMPSYRDLALLHRAAFPGYAYQVFAPPEQHVNIHEHALHLWGRVDGKPALPEFGAGGTI
jgi:hypothetical protein